MKRASVVFLLAVLAVAVSPGSAQESAKARFGELDRVETVTITDSKGVVTTATGFGKIFGPAYLNAYRGDSEVQVPFDRVSSIRTGEITDNRMQVDIVLLTGRRLQVVVDRPEYETLYGGSADFGYFRIRLMDIGSIDFGRKHPKGEGVGQRCGKAHIYYNDAWRYCPYDGEKLASIRAEE